MPHKTVYVDLQGKCKWLNVKIPDQFGKWGLLLFPDPASIDTIKKMQAGWFEGVEGIKNMLKDSEEDGVSIRLSRPSSKERKGKLVGFNPPELLQADGNTPLRDTMVGNGSDVTCKCELYFFMTPLKKQSSAIRLMSVRIDNLIPFVSDRDFTEEQKKLTEGMDKVPRPQW